MALQTWHIYGFGIQTDKIKTTADKIRSLININCDIKNDILEQIGDDKKYKTATLNELLDLIMELERIDDNDVISTLLSMVIYADSGIEMMSVTSYNEENFVIFPRFYPWQLTKAEQNLKSEDDLKAIFEKYVGILTDQSLDELNFGHQEIENCG
jgi:hypothetical protein